MKHKKIWGTLHPFFEGGPIFGRKVANRCFLQALLHADVFDEYHFFLPNLALREALLKALADEFPTLYQRGAFHIAPPNRLAHALRTTKYHCFHFSDWAGAFVNVSIMRNAFSKNLFPITAPVHSLSYSYYGQKFLYHLWGGVSPRDTIVATSRATQRVIENYFNQLRHGYGLSHESFFQPGVRRVPLGVSLSQFASPEVKKETGAPLRARLKIADDEVMFLSFSRVSLASKMDFFPILDAFKLAEDLGLRSRKYHVVVAGTMEKESPYCQALLKFSAQKNIKLSLVKFPDVPSDEQRKNIFAAADVFISPVDNIQETFGLTVLEAYAASLPVIASDIDGYKDLVVSGKTGELIPTLWGSSLDYSTKTAAVTAVDDYHLTLGQQCVVDLPRLARALASLGGDAGLRKKMGEAGHASLSPYTWDAVIEQYNALWDELNAMPMAAGEERRIREAKHPALPDYAQIFSHYCSETSASPALRQRLVQATEQGVAVAHSRAPIVLHAPLQGMLDSAKLKQMLLAAEVPIAYATLAESYAPEPDEADKEFLLLWALKHNLLRFIA